MKEFSLAYQPDKYDEPVTVGKIAKLYTKHESEWIGRFSQDYNKKPVLIMTYEQHAQLIMDPMLHRWNSPGGRIKEIYGFHVVITE